MNIGLFTFFLEIKIKPPPCSPNLNEPQRPPKECRRHQKYIGDITVVRRRGLRDSHLGDVTTTAGPALYGPAAARSQQLAGVFIPGQTLEMIGWGPWPCDDVAKWARCPAANPHYTFIQQLTFIPKYSHIFWPLSAENFSVHLKQVAMVFSITC